MGRAVYRDFDAEAMDRQYNPRLAVDDVDSVIADWASRSAAFTARISCELDIAYGPRPAETLDLYKPENHGAPVLIFIHGGYWRALDKQPYAFSTEPLVAAGALVASINYTLCPAVTLDEVVRQSRAACEWVWRNAAAHGGDASRIHVAGHSAGGHLAAMMAATQWPDVAEDLPTDLLKSATSVSGLFDLEPILATPVNDDVRMDAAMAARNSPMALPPAHDFPMTIAVGGAETDGENHFTVVEGQVNPDSPITRAILGHMGL